jgi:hypothetical protein
VICDALRGPLDIEEGPFGNAGSTFFDSPELVPMGSTELVIDQSGFPGRERERSARTQWGVEPNAQRKGGVFRALRLGLGSAMRWICHKQQATSHKNPPATASRQFTGMYLSSDPRLLLASPAIRQLRVAGRGPVCRVIQQRTAGFALLCMVYWLLAVLGSCLA